MDPITIRYCFTMEDGSREVFNLRLDPRKIELITEKQADLPIWTDLVFHQCPNCPLSNQTHPNCLIAVSLVSIVKGFEGLISYNKVHVDVESEGRLVSQDTTVQRGVSALMGLLIATSGCPHAAFFKPMARFHQPMASRDETIYRATSSYLMAQYFRKNDGLRADFELEGLKKIYNNMRTVNIAIAKRLRAASETDSSVNAIILLDVYTQALPLVIEESLARIRHLYEPYFGANAL